MITSKGFVLATLLLPLSASSVYALEIEQGAGREDAFLELFRTNPQQALDKIPTKRNSKGDIVTSTGLFSEQDIEDKSFIEQKDQVRSEFCSIEEDGTRLCLGDYAPGRAPIGRKDRAERLVDNGEDMITNIVAMDARSLRNAQLPDTPWTDDYWALYKGAAAARYGDRNFTDLGQSYERTYNYVLENPALTILQSGDIRAINQLSPAEKYDILVGDNSFTLTKANWAQGKPFFEQKGEVERWMGLCHGWAAVSYTLDRPENAQVLPTPSGLDITFYPSDIKALGTLLYAQVSADTKLIGQRCNIKDPEKDENGRVLDDGCFDTNPGTWHKAVVNQIGVAKRSIIIDATYDYEVWNQPVYSYNYTYFNPKKLRLVDNYKRALVRANFAGDRFAQYRDPNAKFIIGVRMSVTYIVEAKPDQRKKTTTKDDLMKTVEYTYDLELDSKGNILGGEWYTNLHPDFLWTPVKGAKARTRADRFTREEWKFGQPVPKSYRRVAQIASESSIPLPAIVEGLFERAK